MLVQQHYEVRDLDLVFGVFHKLYMETKIFLGGRVLRAS